MENTTIRIIAAVVDTHALVLYKEDGTTLDIPQGDFRVRAILDKAVPLLVHQGYADISLDSIKPKNDYSEFEKASGAIKLFKVAKNKLKEWFGIKEEPDTPVIPMSFGKIPNQTMAAIEEILQHATPVSAPDFNENTVHKQGNVVEDTGQTLRGHDAEQADDTIIAVVNNQVIPGMEKIKTQFSKANSLGSIKGMEAFLNRLSTVIQDRKHSVEDLLKFMERGDLPIADDGCILIYKVLNKRGEKYVDCHTNKVEQWVGGYVCMDPSLVDHNRNNECSNGLHVARRGYIREFSGDVCVLAKVAPEDVIAVPSYDANKMRVCGYHIIAELTQTQFSLLRQNKPITDDPCGKLLLAKAMSGQHIGKTHEIRITGHKGEGVKFTNLVPKKPIKKQPVVPVEAIQNPSVEAKESVLDPKEVVQKVEQLSRKDQALKLYNSGDIEALKAFKKAAKVSWDKLGVPDPDAVPPTVVTSKLVEGTYKERIQKLLAIGITSIGVAKAILELKKKSKKSWHVLGVSDAQAAQIIELTQ